MNVQVAYMQRALTDVRGVETEVETVRDAYGALCHQVPILVLTQGLSVTAAFIDAKATGDGAATRHFRLMRRHMIAALDGGQNVTQLSDAVSGDPGAYMLQTATILDAWVFYKRFAVSILDVEPGKVDPVADPPPLDPTADGDAAPNEQAPTTGQEG